MSLNCEIILNKKKSLDKPYFDKMYNKFSRLVQESLILEEKRLRRYYHKPSRYKRLKKEFARLKWRTPR